MAIHKVFKGEKKGDSLRCCYLYRDGHVVCVFERHELGVRLEYVKVAESIGVSVIGSSEDFTRVVFHDPALLIAFTSTGKKCYISAYTPSLERGSPNTKAKNMPIGYITLGLEGAGSFSVYQNDLISSGITIQGNNSINGIWDYIAEEKFNPSAHEWGDKRVLKVYGAAA
jgi:hypothetical protein